MVPDTLESWIKQLQPVSWPETISHILSSCLQAVLAARHGEMYSVVVLPAIADAPDPFTSPPLPDLAVRKFPGDGGTDMADLDRRAEQVFLPLAFQYTWESESLWGWIIRNATAGARVSVTLANLSYLPLLHHLINSSFPMARHGMKGPLKDSRQWQDYFLDKGCANITLDWSPVACFVNDQIEELDTDLHLSPSYSLSMTLPDAPNGMVP